MKFVMKTFICLWLLTSVVAAAPKLCAVYLSDNTAIEEWVSMNIPTFEYIDRIALAEVNGSMVSFLRQKGFDLSIIDDTPWQGRYYLGSVPDNRDLQLPGRTIWQTGHVYLIEVQEQDLVAMHSLPVLWQPVYKKPLPNRFWRELTAKVVSIPIEYDPFIQTIVDQVNSDTIMTLVQRLEDFRTRLTHSDSSFAASQWIFDKFTDWGYTPVFDSFYVDTAMASWGYWPDTGYERNVVATSNGTMNPLTQMIICGHHDAIIWWDTALARINAPGADDNATGTVAAMEAARIFRNYSWEPSIKFITWGTEELGLYGSYHYAGMADSLGWDIGGVMNGDMIGFMDDAELDCVIQRRDSTGLWLSDMYERAAQLYVPQLIVYKTTSTGGSDWYPFARLGYPSVGAMENSGSYWNPFYHDTTDKTSTLTASFFVLATKVEIATLAILGIYPGPIKDVIARDIGNGSDLEVSWTQSSQTDIAGYTIYFGMQSQVYTDTIDVPGATTGQDTLTGLMTDSTYYVAVTAYDTDGHESYAALEVIGVPRIVPFAPTGVTASPIIAGIRIDWQPNKELDLDGYRIYRRINENPTWDSLNTILLTDTTFTNAPLSGANKYYYAIRAFDDDGNASPLSEEVYGRPVTLDQRILVVDETRNGGGPNPPDSLQDQFYQYILQDYPFTEYEFGNLAERPVLADLVPYSTVVWHADDFSQLWASDNVDDLKAYMEYGGNVWFVGWKPTANLMSNTIYPATYGPGDFVHDYMFVGEVALSSSADSFATAMGQAAYPDLEVDTARVSGGVLYLIEAYLYSSPGEEIYTIHMYNNGSPFEGSTCGIRYLGTTYKTVLFGFPLYYMDMDDARAAAQKVMSDFNEVGIAEIDKGIGIISGVTLYQNTPNPFIKNTSITYQIPSAGMVKLCIYNVLGQRIRTLAEGLHDPGVYTIPWNAQDDDGYHVANGIYFSKLEAMGVTQIKKMVVVR